MIDDIIDVLSDYVLWLEDHSTSAFSSVFVGWGFTIVVLMGSIIALPFILGLLTKIPGTSGERNPNVRLVIFLAQVVVTFAGLCLGVSALVVAGQKTHAENERNAQQHAEEVEQTAEEMVGDIDGVVDFEVDASDPDDEGLGTVIISAESESSREVAYASLTHSDAEQFDEVWVRLLGDVDIYGVDNATFVDAFLFNTDEVEADELDVETVFHHGNRSDYDPASRGSGSLWG